MSCLRPFLLLGIHNQHHRHHDRRRRLHRCGVCVDILLRQIGGENKSYTAVTSHWSFSHPVSTGNFCLVSLLLRSLHSCNAIHSCSKGTKVFKSGSRLSYLVTSITVATKTNEPKNHANIISIRQASTQAGARDVALT